MSEILASDIAKFLETKLYGDDISIRQVSPFHNIQENSLIFSKDSDIKINTKCFAILPNDYKENKNEIFSYAKVKDPRLCYAKTIKEFFAPKKESFISPNAHIGANTTISKHVSIGHNCVIGDNVKIGHSTIINHNVVIYDNVQIGANCYIKSGSIIGEEGFGFSFEEDKTPVMLPHLGSVIIEDDVEIGAKCTIARGVIENTIIKKHVKIDDHVLIAHNCYIDEKTIITGGAILGGSVKLGKKCWLSPNSTLMKKITLQDNVLVGTGTTAFRNIKQNTCVSHSSKLIYIKRK